MRRCKSLTLSLSLVAVLLIFVFSLLMPGRIRAETPDVEADPDMIEQGLAGLNIRAGSGLTAGFLRMNISDLNDMLDDAGFPDLDRNIFIYGFGAVAGRVEGDRLGTVYRRGSVDSSSADKSSSLSISYGGLVYERGRKIEDREDADIALGVMGGIGSMELFIRAGEAGEFSDILTDTYEGEQNTATLDKNFLALRPGINLHYSVRGPLALDLSAGYLLTHDLGRGWQLGDSSVDTDPVSNLRGPELTLQLSYTF